MPWVKFTSPFDWKPQPNVTIAYLPGQVKLVTTPCAEAVVAKGKGARVKKPASERKNGP